MKYTPIAMSFDDNYGVPGWITVYSLFKHAHVDTAYHVFILKTVDGINQQLQKEIQQLTYNTNHKITFIDISAERFKDVKIGWSGLPTYFRLILHEYITEYENVIWTDVDVLILDDLSSVMDYDVSHTYWAGHQCEPNDPDYIFHGFYPENPNAFNYMPGFMLVNLKKMRDDNMSQIFFDNLKKYDDKIPFYDLTILNVSCPNIGKLPVKYCVLECFYPKIDKRSLDYENIKFSYTDNELEKAVENPSILHFAGFPVKIWKRHYLVIPQYYRDYMDICPIYQKPSEKEMLPSFIKFLQQEIKREGKYLIKDIVKKYVPDFLYGSFRKIWIYFKYFLSWFHRKDHKNNQKVVRTFAYYCAQNDWYMRDIFDQITSYELRHSEVFCSNADLEHIFKMKSDSTIGTGQTILSVFGAGFAEKEEGYFTPVRDKIIFPLQLRKKTFCCALRGKLTMDRIKKQEQIEIYENVVLGDSSLLAIDLLTEIPTKKYSLGIALTDETKKQALLKEVNNSVIIDKTMLYMDYLTLIAQCETIVSDELLPLVLADSLSIPNLWVDSLDSYKHLDYYSAYNIKDVQAISYDSLKGDIPQFIQKHNRVDTNLVQEKINALRKLVHLIKNDTLKG